MIGRAARAGCAGALLVAAALAAGCRGEKREEARLTTAQERSPELLAILAEAATAYQRGNLPLTEQALRKASQVAPDDPEVALDLGDTLTRSQQLDAARRHYEAFLRRHPSATSVRLALGLTLMGLGHWDDSASQIRRVVEHALEDAVARLNLGIALSKLGRYADAVAELQRAAELAPTDPAVFKELGSALMGAGRLEEAATALEHALTLDPESPPAWFALGRCYARLGRKEEARQALERFTLASGGRERYLDQKRLFRAAQGRAESLSREGKHMEALSALLAYRDSLEDFPLFQQELGVIYLRLGRPAEAIAALERAVSGDRTLQEAYGHLAVLYQQEGLSDKAMRARQSALHPVASGPLPSDPP